MFRDRGDLKRGRRSRDLAIGRSRDLAIGRSRDLERGRSTATKSSRKGRVNEDEKALNDELDRLAEQRRKKKKVVQKNEKKKKLEQNIYKKNDNVKQVYVTKKYNYEINLLFLTLNLNCFN